MIVLKKMKADIKTFSQTQKIISFCLIIVAGYAFFFNSKVILPNGESFTTTPYNAVQAFSDQRTVALSRWNYSPDQQLMEVEVEISNSSFDGVDEYDYISLVRTGGGAIKKYPVKKILEAPDFSVVQIQNIPQNYKSVSLRLQPHGYGDDSIVKLYGSPDSIKQVSSIQTRTVSEYQKLRIDEQIQGYKDAIQTLQIEYDAAQKKIENIVAKNKLLDGSKQYQTAEDIEKTNETISDNKSIMDNLKNDQEENTKQQHEYSLKIQKAQEKKASIK